MDALRFRLRVFLGLTLLILFGGTIGFMQVEGLTLGDALYFCLVTVTTVGYGDISPRSGPGKMLAVIVIMGGIGAFTGVVANATEMLLSSHERALRQQKLHMVRGLFFSEMGAQLLALLTAADPNQAELAEELNISAAWDPARFSRVKARMLKYDYGQDPKMLDTDGLSTFLEARGDFLLRLLENPSLLEEEGLTEALRAVFHLRDELVHRKGISPLPASDVGHLCGDAGRAYQRLTRQWLDYVDYLQRHYPYLFSLAIRTNPFEPDASPVVREA